MGTVSRALSPPRPRRKDQMYPKIGAIEYMYPIRIPMRSVRTVTTFKGDSVHEVGGFWST